MAFGCKYRCEYYDNGGLAWKWEFEWDTYVGDVNTMQASGNPGTYEPLADSDDLFDNPIRGIKATLRVRETSSFQYIDFYTINDLTIRCSIYYGSTLYFRGWVQARTYSEPYDDHLSGPEIVITAICGLGALKNIAYDNAGTAYTGHKYESEIILDILAKINATSFTEIVNVYEESMTATSGYSPMDQMKIDVSVFDDMSCYDVLAHLLIKWTALIRQWKGVFHIYRPKEMISTTAYYRTFTAATTKTSGTVNYVQSIKRSGVTSDLRDHNGGAMMLVAPAKKLTLRQDFGYKDSWILNWQFKGSKFTGTIGTAFYAESWTQYGMSVPYIVPINRGIASEHDGVVINDFNDYGTGLTKYLYQSFGSNIIVGTEVFCLQFEYRWFNSGSTHNAQKIYFQLRADNENYSLNTVDDLEAEWVTPVTDMYIQEDVAPGDSGWKTWSRIIDGVSYAGPWTIKFYAPDDTYTDTRYGIRNVRVFSTADKINTLWRPYTLKGKGFMGLMNKIYRWLYGTGYSTEEYIDQPEVVQKNYEITNAINGDEIERGHILGDVLPADVDIDNIIEQFKGALVTSITTLQARVDTMTITCDSTPATATITANGAVAQTLTFASDIPTSISNFVGDSGIVAAFAAVNIQISQGTGGATDTLIFTSTVNGADFDPEPSLTPVTGGFDGAVVETTPSSVTVVSPTSDWNTRGGSESDPLLELIGAELGVQFSRPRQLISLPVWDLTGADTDPHVNIIGTFQDSLNVISAVPRKFAFNRGTYDMKNRHWDMDLIELVE